MEGVVDDAFAAQGERGSMKMFEKADSREFTV